MNFLCVLRDSVVFMVLGLPFISPAGPVAEREAFRALHAERFPGVALKDFVLGAYAIDPRLRAQYEELKEFPPYEFDLDRGRELYQAPLADGGRYADCLGEDTGAIRPSYPRFDPERGEVVTLELAINECRARHGEKPLRWAMGDIAVISAWLAYEARGRELAVEEPRGAALAAWREGRDFFRSKRGQLNFSCADCHLKALGKRLRDRSPDPLLGAVNHYPVYALRAGGLRTLHWRFSACLYLTRSAPLPYQGRAYRNLEYYLSFLGTGLPINGPEIHR